MSLPIATRCRRTRGPATGTGFTLVELLVVLAVLGVLGMLISPMAEMAAQRDRERELKRALWEIRDAIDAYQRAAAQKLINANRAPALLGPVYPANLQVLTQGVPEASGSGQLVYFLRRVPRDPFADPALPAEQTWTLRSYQSSHDRPQAGADVYDVRSKTDKRALDGTWLRDW